MNAVPSSSPFSQDLARTLAADIDNSISDNSISHSANHEPVMGMTIQRIKAGIASITGQVIDVTVHANNSGVAPAISTLDESGLNQAEPARLDNGAVHLNSTETSDSPATSSALTTAKGSFSSFLAPLKQDTFKQVVTSVEGKLEVVNQTLSMLDDALSSQKFDAILDEMLRSITLKTGELLNADRTTIFILDEEKDELWSIVAKDERGNNLELRVPKNVGIAGAVATTKQAVNIPYDFYADPRSKAAQELDKKNHYRTYTMLTMPLLSEKRGETGAEDNKLVAVVQLINKLKPNHDPHAPLEQKIDLQGFTATDEQLFWDFAPSIRLILESSRSFYQATQQQRAASALMKATKALSQSSLDLEETLKMVMDEAKELMQADRSTLWLVDRDRHQLWTKLPINGTLQEIRIPMEAGFAGQVVQSEQPLLIPFDLYNHPNSDTAKETDKKTGYRTCSMLCMPIFNADKELIAVTQLINKKKQGDHLPYNPETYPEAPDCWRASFNRADLEFMKAFNIQAGVALQNAKLFATVKQQEQMQRDILRSLSNGVISTDKDGKIIAANESARELLGLDARDVIEGKAVVELIQLEKGDFPRWFEMALRAQDDRNRQQYYPDQTLQAFNGEQHSINLSINTIADANDEQQISGALVVMDDISDEKRLKSTMYRYMTQELAEQLLNSGDAKLGGDRKEVSVLFSDIRSYTTLTESMEAEEVVAMLNEYFETMVDAVFAYKGTLDKYIGDAIMAVFGSPLELEEHAWMAVQTAIEMRHRLASFNQQRPSHRRIKIGVGINSDSVISGNIGSSKRMEFTAIGDGVNLGSRLEGASKHYGTDIVISQSTYNSCRDRIWARELDCIRVKGKLQPVSIYELVGLQSEPLTDAQKRSIELYHIGRDHYLNRRFTKAQTAFGTILEEINAHDQAAVLHVNRCGYWLSHLDLIDTHWDDGVWTMKEK
ncbi:adenylate/guanylate cyclase domain-containing protein [Thermocoleostomius sinensis]|uniref:GAF domain-containing protein n=1 Tax=Thermocoleostomius sinensis A174 TaxID=2016057 RepID=A0A9E9CAC7_9CYAN|nr:adenylate/guanylate cyclase domain-containing protein [Thermocoleostomius sinensis]WAL60812.1 GAF domain-containing protein [Thermocoleostomius sinensis A174]